MNGYLTGKCGLKSTSMFSQEGVGWALETLVGVSSFEDAEKDRIQGQTSLLQCFANSWSSRLMAVVLQSEGSALRLVRRLLNPKQVQYMPPSAVSSNTFFYLFRGLQVVRRLRGLKAMKKMRMARKSHGMQSLLVPAWRTVS